MVTELPNRDKIKNVSENNLDAKPIHCWNLSCNRHNALIRVARNRMRHVKKEIENRNDETFGSILSCSTDF